jgi:dihydroorotase-like cyclic amidohydrolase
VNDEDFLKTLSKHPALRKRMEQILNIAEDADEDIELADTAEERLIEAGRHLNKESLEAWANNKVKQSVARFEKTHKHVRKDVKKNSTGIVPSEQSK